MRYFGTDGIRGHANKYPITADIALKVGMASGILFTRGDYRHRVVIGKDTRLSGYMLENALVAGFTAAGMDVFQLGPVPTPAVSMLTRSLRADIGVMISASHNSFEDNGIKLFGPDGYKLSNELEQKIETLIDKDLSTQMAQTINIGRAKRIDGVLDRYIEFAKRTMPRDISLNGLKIVIDCANGAAYKVAPAALWEMGGDVIALSINPDGTNINKQCGSTDITLLAKRVIAERADIGIALDGDADRVVLVDEKGQLVDGDQLMALVAQSWQQQNRLRGGGIVATIMSNLALEQFLHSQKLTLTRTAVGDKNVIATMRQGGFNVGGESSGHIILSDYATTGDGLVAALQVLSVVKTWAKPVSEVCKRFEPVPQILHNIQYTNKNPLETNEVKQAIKQAEAELGKQGRLVIRTSGTEPLIRIMAESNDETLAEKIVRDITEVVEKVVE